MVDKRETEWLRCTIKGEKRFKTLEGDIIILEPGWKGKVPKELALQWINQGKAARPTKDHLNALHKLQKMVQSEWNSPHHPASANLWSFSEKALGAIKKTLRLLPPERIPGDFNLQDELNKALSRYLIRKAQREGTPHSAEVKKQLENIAGLAKLLSWCLLQMHDEVRDLLRSADDMGGQGGSSGELHPLLWTLELAALSAQGELLIGNSPHREQASSLTPLVERLKDMSDIEHFLCAAWKSQLLRRIEEDTRQLTWKAHIALANYSTKVGRPSDDSLDYLIGSLIWIYETATGEIANRTIDRKGKPTGPFSLFAKVFLTRAEGFIRINGEFIRIYHDRATPAAKKEKAGQDTEERFPFSDLALDGHIKRVLKSRGISIPEKE